MTYINPLKRLTILIFCIFCGCLQTQDQNKIFVDVKDITNVSIHDCFERIEIIPLETTQDALIRYIRKIIHNDNHYFVIDYNKNVYKISEEGEFLNEIGRFGRGPGEHLDVVDIQINEYTSNLELLIPMGKIDIFSIDGEYLESLNLDTYAHDFIIINEDLILLHFLVGDYKLKFFSRSEGRVIAQEYPMSEEINKRMPVGDTDPLWKRDGNAYFHFPFSNEIFQIDGFKLKHLYSIDCGNYSFDLSDINWKTGLNRKYYSEKISESSDIATFFHFHIENEEIIMKRFLNGDKQNRPLFLYDKSTSETKVFIDFEEGVTLPMLYNYDPNSQIIYGAVEPHDINNYIVKDLLDKENIEKLTNINPDDNPVIVKYYLK